MGEQHFSTEQEAFWAGEFGAEYISRNRGPARLASDVRFFSRALNSCGALESCIEFGANIGINIKALKLLYPGIEAHAIEINDKAVEELAQVVSKENIFSQSILEFEPRRQWDLALVKGVLIHINPNSLNEVYDSLVASCGRYLLVSEYYNPVPVAIEYRGHENKLFKRDFAGEIMDRHPQMKLLDYGFTYRRDPQFPQDDLTWFLMEKETGDATNR